ncbi:Os02g0118850 [Oryza sativa Japonica Group]|uniref:Os02g0118850 protein n=1 Tax=Oryza sativa subsp. japonica TaxID=39947 RepID=A0A0P0VE48_ORYSJ|nr:hypothetical protein EE612_008487 [Oryza sativa]BAS76683.1 Os02g0118850 [Oryza sativa Japonica Group]
MGSSSLNRDQNTRDCRDVRCLHSDVVRTEAPSVHRTSSRDQIPEAPSCCDTSCRHGVTPGESRVVKRLRFLMDCKPSIEASDLQS